MKTIYYVHDQQESPVIRRDLLEMAGYRVESMASARDLFISLKEVEPDLVLIDVLIEGQNGFEAALEIHSKFPERRFPIVLSSSIYRARQFRDEALRCGAQDYHLLPMKPELFLGRIARSIEEFAASHGGGPGTAAA